jgi:hypothetical protein
MTESARDEALRLAREAGFDLHWPAEPEVGLFRDGWVADGDQIIKLISLARVGWIEIDKAAELAARQRPEPVESGLDERRYFLAADSEVQYAVPDGYESEILKAGTYVWLARWTDDQLEDARRRARELHEKDERIKELEIIVQNRGMALEKRAQVHEENRQLKAEVIAHQGLSAGYQKRAEAAEARIPDLQIAFDLATERANVAELERDRLMQQGLKMANAYSEAESALAGAKAQALRDLIDRFDKEWLGPAPIKADVAGWIWRVASEHERGESC